MRVARGCAPLILELSSEKFLFPISRSRGDGAAVVPLNFKGTALERGIAGGRKRIEGGARDCCGVWLMRPLFICHILCLLKKLFAPLVRVTDWRAEWTDCFIYGRTRVAGHAWTRIYIGRVYRCADGNIARGACSCLFLRLTDISREE